MEPGGLCSPNDSEESVEEEGTDLPLCISPEPGSITPTLKLPRARDCTPCSDSRQGQHELLGVVEESAESWPHHLHNESEDTACKQASGNEDLRQLTHKSSISTGI